MTTSNASGANRASWVGSTVAFVAIAFLGASGCAPNLGGSGTTYVFTNNCADVVRVFMSTSTSTENPPDDAADAEFFLHNPTGTERIPSQGELVYAGPEYVNERTVFVAFAVEPNDLREGQSVATYAVAFGRLSDSNTREVEVDGQPAVSVDLTGDFCPVRETSGD